MEIKQYDLTTAPYEVKAMPTCFRDYLSNRKLVSKSDTDTFLRNIPLLERMATFNNLVAYEWYTGLVRTVHNDLLSSGIATRIIKALNDKLHGGPIRIEGPDPDTNTEIISKIFKQSILKKATIEMLARGAVLLKIDDDIDRELCLTFTPLGKFSLMIDNHGNITEAQVFLDVYSYGSTRKDYYTIVEYRGYDNDHRPYAEYRVLYTKFSNADDLFEKRIINDWIDKKNIPEDITKRYSSINFNSKTYLKFQDLGVALLNNSEVNTKFPNMWFGESQLSDCLDWLYSSDSGFTGKDNDKYLGRGKVLVPEIMNANAEPYLIDNRTDLIGDFDSISRVRGRTAARMLRSPMDQTFFQMIPSYKVDDSKPVSVQFDLRTEQWQSDIDFNDRKACVLCGIAPGDVDPSFTQGVQKTDDQVDAEKDLTTSTVEGKRDLITDEINKIIADIAFFYGIANPEDYKLVWTLAGLSNTTARTNRTKSLYESGLMSRRRALKELHPDWTLKEIEEEEALLDSEADKQTEDALLSTV